MSEVVIWVRRKTFISLALAVVFIGLAILAEPSWKRFWATLGISMVAFSLGSIGE